MDWIKLTLCVFLDECSFVTRLVLWSCIPPTCSLDTQKSFRWHRWHQTKNILIYHILILSLFKAHLEGLLIARECLRPCLHLVHVLAAVDLVLQRVLLVEVRLLQMFLKPRTEVSTHLALQVASDPLPLELDHPELGAGVGGHSVLVQGADATHLLQQKYFC